MSRNRVLIGDIILVAFVLFILLFGSEINLSSEQTISSNLESERPRLEEPKQEAGLGNLCLFNAEENCRIFCNKSEENKKSCASYCEEHPDNQFCRDHISSLTSQEKQTLQYSTLKEESPPFYEKEITFDEDLVISSGLRNFTNVHLIFKGNLIVNGTGRLIISDAHIDFKQKHHFHQYVYGKDKAQIEWKNVYASTNDKWMLFDYRGNTRVIINNFSSRDGNIPWHGTGESAVVEVSNSKIGITPWINTSLTAKNSDLFVEVSFVDAGGIFKLPLGYTDNFDLEIKNKEGLTLKLKTENTTFSAWGTTLGKNANVTFVDTVITIGINAGADWSIWPGPLNPRVKVSDLKAKKYEDFTLRYDTNILRLVNTEVTTWYPQAYREAVVEITNSDLADVSTNGQNARLIIRNSTAAIAVARENVTYEFYDSLIQGDVVAQDQGDIYLYNTKVWGTITQKDQGRVYVDSEGIQGVKRVSTEISLFR